LNYYPTVPICQYLLSCCLKVEKVPINNVKSDLALSAMSPVNKNTKELPTASNKSDVTNKNGKIKYTEKVKRAMSERNLHF
jgi:hypothetical protein